MPYFTVIYKAINLPNKMEIKCGFLSIRKTKFAKKSFPSSSHRQIHILIRHIKENIYLQHWYFLYYICCIRNGIASDSQSDVRNGINEIGRPKRNQARTSETG